MSDTQVIGLPQSNYVWAVRIGLEEKGVAYDLLPVWSHSPEASALHPLGKIPGFRHRGVSICESRAILDYIDAAFEGPPLVPADLAGKTRCDVWTSIVTTSLEPLLIRQYVFAFMFPQTADGQPDRALIDRILVKVEAALDLLEAALASRDIGGEPFGRVDAYLVPILFYVRSLPEGGAMMARRPGLTGYLDHRLMRASVQATLPQPLPSRT